MPSVTINKKTYEKCSPEESEMLDIQFDTDDYGWASEKEYITPIEASLYKIGELLNHCLLYTSPSPRDGLLSRMPSSA